ncbi:hypothetical protein PIROE2DRAFT_20524 [Piromyces sp. E2]|nr:hypothetical protein PIROE2DRAFT_20524 [Piromyces sp. E2]|eukprot:OUM64438.1 hypothetical protein PIROE2DRAFT_20524 [Piromyces sp. E2]
MSKETGSKLYLYGICGVAVIGGLLFGYDTAVISGAEQALQNFFVAGIGPEYSNGSLGKYLHGFVTSSALIGCIIGGFISGAMASRFGRKISLIISSVLFFLSALGSYMPEFLFRSDFSLYKPEESTYGVMWTFILYRILGGIGVGVASALCPMYIAEISPAEIRGKLVSWNQFAIILGQLIVYFINTIIRSSLGSNADEIKVAMDRVGWRRMFVSEAFPAALFGILLIFVPKTPRFLLLKNQPEKAKDVLTRINGAGKAEEIFEDIKDTINNEKKEKLLSYGYKVIIVGVLLSFFQQAVGINSVLYFAPRIFESMGASSGDSMVQTVVMGVINILFTLVAIFTTDKLGRKPLLMVGSIGMALGMAALSILAFNTDTDKEMSKAVAILTLVFVIIYTASFMASWGPMCWVLISEIFPNTIRAAAVAIAVAAQWISNFGISFSFLALQDWSMGGTYLIYAFFSILSFIFVFKMVPETKNKTLEDMNALWRGIKNPQKGETKV